MTSASSRTLRQITSDRNEHPTFATLLDTALQLLVNARKVVINAETEHFDQVYAAATTTTYPEASICLPVLASDLNAMISILIFALIVRKLTLLRVRFTLVPVTEKAAALNIGGHYSLALIGDFNESNATAAIIGAGLAGVWMHLPLFRVLQKLKSPVAWSIRKLPDMVLSMLIVRTTTLV